MRFFSRRCTNLAELVPGPPGTLLGPAESQNQTKKYKGMPLLKVIGK